MANWIGAGRSNYVKIKPKSMKALRASLAPFAVEIVEGAGLNKGAVCFLSTSESGGFESGWDTENDTDIDFDPAVQICPHMVKGQVLVLMEAGAEKLRYITGHAQAYHSDGRNVTVSLTDIYAKAAEAFGVNEKSITAAQY